MEVTEKFSTCDGCHSDRTVYWYRGIWLCKGPDRCWRHRRNLYAIKKAKERKEE